jgi:hypothetical protein
MTKLFLLAKNDIGYNNRFLSAWLADRNDKHTVGIWGGGIGAQRRSHLPLAHALVMSFRPKGEIYHQIITKQN